MSKMEMKSMGIPSAMLLAFVDVLTDESLGKLIRATVERQTNGTPFPDTDDIPLALAMALMEYRIEREEKRQAPERERARENPPNYTFMRSDPNERRHEQWQI